MTLEDSYARISSICRGIGQDRHSDLGRDVQNEPSNAPKWPAMMWTLEEQASFAADFLRPAFNEKFPEMRIFINDDSTHNLRWPVRDLVTPEQAAAVDGLTVHTYEGPYSNFFNASRSYSHWMFGMTERRCMIEETPEDAAHIMSGIIGNWLVRNGVGLINLWNMALDEQGFPSYAGTSGRRGVITIDSKTGKVKRNLEYFMLRNYGQDVPVGSRRIGSTNYTPDGRKGGLGSVAFVTKRGDLSAILYNPTDKPILAAVTVNGEGSRWQRVEVPAYGTVTVHKSDRAINRSEVPADDDFEITYTPHPADDHDETLSDDRIVCDLSRSESPKHDAGWYWIRGWTEEAQDGKNAESASYGTGGDCAGRRPCRMWRGTGYFRTG